MWRAFGSLVALEEVKTKGDLWFADQVMQGAATCFYAFIGFDIIATTGEEAKNPNTSIPYAITASLVACLTAYVSVSVLWVIFPFYHIELHLSYLGLRQFWPTLP